MHNYREKTAFEDMIKNIQQNKYSKYKYPMGYYKKINEQLEAHKAKGKSIQMRRNIIKAQQISNYQNEYDKIRSILEQSITKRVRGQTDEEYKQIKKLLFNQLGANEDVLLKRKEYLQKLGARHINEIS